MTSSIFVRSKLHCATACQAQEWCNSFFYNDVIKTCVPQWLVHVSPNDAVMTPGWIYFRVTSASCPKFGSASSNESYVIDRVSVTCYRVVTSPKLTWLASRDACTNNNERLTVLEPVEKARFIQFFLNTNTAFFGFTGSFAVGASRPQAVWNTSWPASGPDFIWVNGQAVNYDATATFWYVNRPNNAQNKDNVVGLKTNKNFTWEDLGESEERVYICERAYYPGN
ncbi:hypothetical protein V1264_015941 [Littorina saxatilis]|uniref:C-type lectin domain-containing protein n=3 Tax=Littorina saxatilis TaxID=31220 RepID=A0AAN9GHD4_9CAEN